MKIRSLEEKVKLQAIVSIALFLAIILLLLKVVLGIG